MHSSKLKGATNYGVQKIKTKSLLKGKKKMKVVCPIKNRMTETSTKSNWQQSWRCNGLIIWKNCIKIPQGAKNSKNNQF